MPTTAGSTRTSTRSMNLMRAAFFEEGKHLDAKGDPDANCWLCKQPIDYSAPPNTTPDSHNLDHYFSVRDYPDLQEDPDNFRHSHALCNTERGADGPSDGLGEAVADWW